MLTPGNSSKASILQIRAKQIRKVRTFSGASAPLTCLALNPVHPQIASAGGDKTIQVWHGDTGQLQATLSGHTSWVYGLAFSPAGDLLASASTDSVVRLWQLQTNHLWDTLDTQNNITFDLAFSPSGSHLAAACADGVVRLWSLKTGNLVWQSTVQNGRLTAIAFAPQGDWLAATANDGSFHLWEITDNFRHTTRSSSHLALTDVAFSPDGAWLVVAGVDNYVKVWGLSSTDLYYTFHCTGAVNAVVWSPDGRLVITRSHAYPGQRGHGAIQFWEIKEKKVIHNLPQWQTQQDRYWITRALAINLAGEQLISYHPKTLNTLQSWDISALNVGPKSIANQTTTLLPIRVVQKAVEIEDYLPTKSSSTSRATTQAANQPARLTWSNVDINHSVARHIATLRLSYTPPGNTLQMSYWLANVAQLGVMPPLCFVQDVGQILSIPAENLKLNRPPHLPVDINTTPYGNFLHHLQQHPLVRAISQWPLSDGVISVIMARLMAGLTFPTTYHHPQQGAVAVEFKRELQQQLAQKGGENTWEQAITYPPPNIKAILDSTHFNQIEAVLERLDLKEIEFLHRYGPGLKRAPDPRTLLDLFDLLQLPTLARQILAQSFSLLPQVNPIALGETSQPYAVGGYTELTHKGGIDNLVPTELAYPKHLFYHRLLNQEALHYGREQSDKANQGLVYIVTQTGPEMKGDDDILARALSLALAQKMTEQGYMVQHSFIGSHWTSPLDLNQPATVQHLLHYQDTGWLKPEPMLTQISQQLEYWQNRTPQRYVLWVLGHYWDADNYQHHISHYQKLNRLAQHYSWFVGVPSTNTLPPVSQQFEHRYQVYYP